MKKIVKGAKAIGNYVGETIIPLYLARDIVYNSLHNMVRKNKWEVDYKEISSRGVASITVPVLMDLILIGTIGEKVYNHFIN